MNLHMSRMGTTVTRMDTPNIAERMTEEVRQVMSSRGMSQRKLASQTGIPLNTLSARLQPHTTRPFNLGELGLVVDALDISMVDLTIRAERSLSAA